MQQNRASLFLLPLLTAGCALYGVSGLAATPYAIAAANLTMPADDPPTTSDGVTAIHMGSSQFTVTGIGEGTVTIGCQYSGPLTQAKIPQQCGIVGPGQVPVQQGETTISGTVYFVPYGEGPVPGLAQLHSVRRPSSRLMAAAVALAGALILGFGFQRRTRRALLLAVLATCTLVGAAGITGCTAGNSNTMTPGTYLYTISAVFTETGSNAIQTASTAVTLTVQ
jgi:hypothetical protein